MALNNFIELAPEGSVGNATFDAEGFGPAKRIAVEFEVEAVGATPTVTFKIQGALGDEDLSDLQYVKADSSTAAAKTGIAVTAVGKTVVFVDGLDKRLLDRIAVVTSSNTNVTFSARAFPVNN